VLREEYRLKVLENRVLSRICVRKRDEVTGGWRELVNEGLSQNIIRVIKPKRIRLAEHAARMG
jgi:hypothetical protein